MLSFVGSQQAPDLRRRLFLQVGGSVAAATASVPRVGAEPVEQRAGFGTARSVLIIFASGGQSQLETWDPKPDAPREVRGEFDSIETAVPGIRLGEHLPRLARLTDRFSIVRSMSHADLDHGSAFYLSMTGRYHQRLSSNPPARPTDHPTHGAVLSRVRPTGSFPHSAVHVNGPAYVPRIEGPGQFAGLLGRDFEPLPIGNVLSEKSPLMGLDPLTTLPVIRRQRRRTLLESIDSWRRSEARNRPMTGMEALYQQAFDLLDRPAARDAFNLAQEPRTIRDRYGWNRSGQACLLARRLVEAGVPWINVFWNHNNRGQDDAPDETDEYGWDTHNDIFEALRQHLLPRFDQGMSALLEDLHQRGLLESTLVVCMGEFGRAPRVALEPRFAGSSPGRKHWASVYSLIAAGAGVQSGRIIGESDRHAAYPTGDRFGPWDLQATLFSALGINSGGHFEDPSGRPHLVSTGKPIKQLF